MTRDVSLTDRFGLRETMIPKTVYFVYGFAILAFGVLITILCRGDIAEMMPLAIPSLLLGSLVIYSAITSNFKGIILTVCWLNIILCAISIPLLMIVASAFSNNPFELFVFLFWLAPPIVVMNIRKKERAEETEKRTNTAMDGSSQ